MSSLLGAARGPSPLVRVIDELLWALRREGFVVAPSQAIDAARAVEAVGLDRAEVVCSALAAVILKRGDDRARFAAAFSAFFGGDASAFRLSFWERMRALGFDDAELELLRRSLEGEGSGDGGGTLASLDDWLDGGADLDRALASAGIARSIDAESGALLGFRTHELLARIGAGRIVRSLATLRALLVSALGARGEAMANAVANEVNRTDERVRLLVRRLFDDRARQAGRRPSRVEEVPFLSLSDAEIEEVRLAVRRFADRLKGGAQVRARRAERGRVDPHRAMRLAMRTDGVPFRVPRKNRRRARPKIMLLCDVSDSVRAVACFLLEFTYAAQELFERARSFVFVSELGETTTLFEREAVRTAIAKAWGGTVVHPGENSNYGRVLRTFERLYLTDVDRRTTVVVLGDGRTNAHDPGAEVLDRVRERSRALVWLTPEPKSRWGQGDSAMRVYAPKCSFVHVVQSASDLERAARVLARAHPRWGTEHE